MASSLNNVVISTYPPPSDISHNIISYNLHGFNQGSPLLCSLCEGNDRPIMLLVQEHWLTPANMHKIINFNDRYTCFGISAMERSVRRSIIRGRPFGGVATLINNELCSKITFVECRDRFVVLIIDNCIYINVYLPSAASDSEIDLLTSVLVELEDVVTTASGQLVGSFHFIVGGDFNLDFDSHSRSAVIVSDLLRKWSLLPCHKIIKGNLAYSYCHETLQHYSLIDYFWISDKNVPDLINYKIIESPINLSDHLPISISIMCTFGNILLSNGCERPSVYPPVISLDWLGGNKAAYYESSRVLLVPIFNQIDLLLNRVKCASDSLEGPSKMPSFELEIEEAYSKLVNALLMASSDTIPVKSNKGKKYWWDQELSVLKRLSIVAHDNWISAGRPRRGVLFEIKLKAKLNFKSCIKNKKKLSLNNLSDSLHEQLLDNSQLSFWKIWKGKFGNKAKANKCIEGLSDDLAISNKFADYYASICKSNSINLDDDRCEFNNLLLRLDSYTGANRSFDSVVDISDIQRIINNLSIGKAAGIDRLTAEHLIFSHPIVVSSLTRLFKVMITCHYVPNAFGLGITVPLPKQDAKGSLNKMESYRGITILPIISKIFEITLEKFVHSFLVSNKSQFGFKKGVGCSHAIFTVRKTCDFFTNNASTVNICALDISKAFDKVNHCKLLHKLMDHNVPLTFILLLKGWLAKAEICVRWGGRLSKSVALSAGLRQGSVLSPHLFAFFVNDVLIALNKCGLGCHIKGFCFNSFMYADDLILLSISIDHLQRLINICNEALLACGLQLNTNKSVAIRIGPRHAHTDISLLLNDKQIVWKTELRYLGVWFSAGNALRCNLQNGRQKFFGATNAILGKIGTRASPAVVLSLVDSFCIPVLLYGLDGMNLNKSSRRAIDSTYASVFSKIYKTSDNIVIRSCQYFSQCLPASCLLDLRSFKFYDGISKLTDSLPQYLLSLLGSDELFKLNEKYHTPLNCCMANRKRFVWDWFSSTVEIDANDGL